MHVKFKPAAASAALVVAAMLSLTSSPAAAQAAPSLTANPSIGLTNGQAIEVSASGFAAGEEIGITQCTYLTDTQQACNGAGIGRAVVDANGNARTSVVVRSTFDAIDVETGQSVGVVRCSTAARGCTVDAANVSLTTFAHTPISFG